MEKLNVVVNQWPIINLPARIMITGCSQSGKTSLLVEMLRNQKHIFGIEFDHVIINKKVE